MKKSVCLWFIAPVLVACETSEKSLDTLSRAELLDPRSCQQCHPQQYNEWSGSMHAYASDDPVFIAMNQRGQRETNGALGNFCLQCHAPMAVREGAAKDGSALETIPAALKGVTCYFCHSVDEVFGENNNQIHLATDGKMRGSNRDSSSQHRPHGAQYSPLLDRDQLESSSMCGACHDVVTLHGADVERTFIEWQNSVFARPTGATCGQCHMEQSFTRNPIANVRNAPDRYSYNHMMPAVDVALQPFADTFRQRQSIETLLASTLQSAVCVNPVTSRIEVILDNVGAGHSWPSGAAHHRRAWVELRAYAGDTLVYSSGVPLEDKAITELNDPDLWLMRACIFDHDNAAVSMLWAGVSVKDNLLTALSTLNPSDPNFYQTHRVKTYPSTGAPLGFFDRVTMQVHLQPIGLDVLDELIASGDLDPAIKAAMPTYNVGDAIEWTYANANDMYLDNESGAPVYCVTNSDLNVRAAKIPATSISCP